MKKVIYQAYPHFYDRMQQFVKENETIKQCDVCFTGDSLVEMYDIERINVDKKVYVNRGIISDKSAGLLMTLNDRVLATNPKTIFIFIGSNDICDGYSLKQIENNYEDILKMIFDYNPNIKVIMSTIIPPCYYYASHVDQIYPACRDILKIEGLNEIINNLAHKYNNLKILDSFTILADENKSLRVDETLDGVHLTLKAYDKISKELIKLL